MPVCKAANGKLDAGFGIYHRDSCCLYFSYSGCLVIAVGSKKILPSTFSYVWRQGFANLYRPNNQTILLVVTIGLGTLFIGTLYFIQGTLMNRVSLSASGNQSNMVLFDIQSSQKEAVAAIAAQFKLPLQQQVPIVTDADRRDQWQNSRRQQERFHLAGSEACL